MKGRAITALLAFLAVPLCVWEAIRGITGVVLCPSALLEDPWIAISRRPV